jgi:hypothetical protein
MAITGAMDLGLGDMSPEAYVRIKDAVFSAGIPEWEIEIHCYHNKEARRLEIIKQFAFQYFVDEGNGDFLSEESKQWIQENIHARSVRPLVTMKFATKNIDGFPITTDKQTVFQFFYNFIKQYHVMGGIQNPQDESSSQDQIINDFKAEHPELFVQDNQNQSS